MNPFIRTYFPLLLCFALVFASCSKQVPVEEQFKGIAVLDALLVGGNEIEGVHVHSLIGSDESFEVSGLNIEIKNDEEAILLEGISGMPGFYQGPSDYLIESLKEYKLTTYYHGEEITAQTTIPPSMSQLDASKDYIDTQVQGDLLFLEWPGINSGTFNEYFYVIEINSTEEDPEAIIRLNTTENQSIVISYNPEATLTTEDFDFYGNHSITVYAISKAYEHLFNTQNSQGQNGPTNITGGYGYFIGASAVETVIEIR